MRASVRFWLPPLLWIAVIFTASSDLFSAAHSGPWLADLIRALIGHPLPPSRFEELHFLIRKGAHVTEYGIFAALLFRAFRAEEVQRWRISWAGASIILAAAVGALDEWHQSFVPSRTSSPRDVLIDTGGAVLAQIMIRLVQMLFFRS